MYSDRGQPQRSVEGPPDDPTRKATQIVRGGYLEIPRLHLTRNQVQHLWRLDGEVCDQVLDALLEARFLTRTPDGAYVRPNGA